MGEPGAGVGKDLSLERETTHTHRPKWRCHYSVAISQVLFRSLWPFSTCAPYIKLLSPLSCVSIFFFTWLTTVPWRIAFDEGELALLSSHIITYFSGGKKKSGRLKGYRTIL